MCLVFADVAVMERHADGQRGTHRWDGTKMRARSLARGIQPLPTAFGQVPRSTKDFDPGDATRTKRIVFGIRGVFRGRF